MYSVHCDGELLFHPEVEELNIIDPVLSLETNTTLGFDFTIYPSHAMYNRIDRLKSIIEVYQDGYLWFRGRVLDDETDFYNAKKIVCEGELAYFNDSVIRPFSYSGDVDGFVQLIIDEHNSQVDDWKQFTLGNVTVEDPNNYIVRSSINTLKTWEVITNRLLDLMGGYLIVRRENNVNYIDYLEDSPYKSEQPIKLGENLLDLTKTIKGADIITALIPYGTKLESEDEEAENRLTIASVNDGVDYVYDVEAVSKYGWIYDTETWDDITIGENLMQRARSELAKRINLAVSLDLNAIDLSMTDNEIDKIRFFEYVETDSPVHLLEGMMLVTKMQIHLTDPSKNTLTLGINYETFSERQNNTEKVIREINEDREITEKELKDIINNQITLLTSSITQTAESIKQEVEETYVSINAFETLQTETSTGFEQTKEAFDFTFTELTTTINDVDDNARAEFNLIESYIRFVDGNIILGEVNNDLITRFESDKWAMSRNSEDVMWLEEDTINIKKANFFEKAQFGNFGFVPRANGSLDFKRVVD
ncbi:phage tail protein [Alkalibacterium sp. f15]|uniref:phage tail protein n=1 Tax=Alkalibacterium sp. f15 TaxID=3414029 RepID=UPI003BF7DBB5